VLAFKVQNSMNEAMRHVHGETYSEPDFEMGLLTCKIEPQVLASMTRPTAFREPGVKLSVAVARCEIWRVCCKSMSVVGDADQSSYDLVQRLVIGYVTPLSDTYIVGCCRPGFQSGAWTARLCPAAPNVRPAHELISPRFEGQQQLCQLLC